MQLQCQVPSSPGLPRTAWFNHTAWWLYPRHSLGTMGAHPGFWRSFDPVAGYPPTPPHGLLVHPAPSYSFQIFLLLLPLLNSSVAVPLGPRRAAPSHAFCGFPQCPGPRAFSLWLLIFPCLLVQEEIKVILVAASPPAAASPGPLLLHSLAGPDKGLGPSTCHFLCAKSICSRVYLRNIAGSANFIRVNYFDECS